MSQPLTIEQIRAEYLPTMRAAVYIKRTRQHLHKLTQGGYFPNMLYIHGHAFYPVADLDAWKARE